MSLGPENDGRVFLDDAHGLSKAADIAMCKRVSETLEAHYPGHPWGIGADHSAGSVVIRLAYPQYDNKPWGYFIPMHNLATDSDFKRNVMRAGGEWLERWNLDRRGYRENDLADAKSSGLDKS